MNIETALAPAQAARILGVSPQSVIVMCQKGRLHYVRTRLGRLLDPDEVRALAEQRQRRAAAAAGSR